MSKKHLHNQAAIPLAPAVFKVSVCYFIISEFIYVIVFGMLILSLGMCVKSSRPRACPGAWLHRNALR